MKTKICKKCGFEKTIDNFCKKSNKKDGLNIYCKSCTSVDGKLYNSKEEVKEKMKKYRQVNKISKEKQKEYNSRYKERFKKYREEHKEELKNYINEYVKNRRKKDPIFRLNKSIRTCIYTSLKEKGYKKSSRTHEILGCSYEFFKEYIEKQFEYWMNWLNYGLYDTSKLNYGWDLDHIIPISSAKNEEIIKLNHYSNFKPLCSKINRDIKINKLNYGL